MNSLTTALTQVFAITSLALITSLSHSAQAQDFLSDEAMDTLFTDPMSITETDQAAIVEAVPLMAHFVAAEETQNFLSDEEIDNLFPDPMAISTDTIQPPPIAMPAIDHIYHVQVGGEVHASGIIMGDHIEYESEGAQACSRIGMIGDSCS